MGECHHEIHIIREDLIPQYGQRWNDVSRSFEAIGPEHVPCEPYLRLNNDDDHYYYEEFHSRAAVEAFIAKLLAAANEIWPTDDTDGPSQPTP